MLSLDPQISFNLCVELCVRAPWNELSVINIDTESYDINSFAQKSYDNTSRFICLATEMVKN